MKTFEYTIQDALGIHARPAGMLVKQAASFRSEVTISAKGKQASLKKLFALMGMGIKQGDVVTVTVNGEDEDEAAKTLEQFLQKNL